MDFSFLHQGIWNASIGTMVLYTLIMTHITIVAVTVYLHRYSAHRALELHPALKHFFRFWLWLTTGMLTKEWTAIHRKHHVHCETEDDPHSPQIFGLRKVLFEGAELYGVTAAKPGDARPLRQRHAGRLDRAQPLQQIQDLGRRHDDGHRPAAVRRHRVSPIWAIQMLWIPFFAAGVINGVGHFWGYRNFECPDAARNLVPWGILIGGEELHNNHHTYPNSAKLSAKPWEFDIGWMWITLFSMLGLARPLSTGPVVEKVPGKAAHRQGHGVGRSQRSLSRDGELRRACGRPDGRTGSAACRRGNASAAQARQIVADARRHAGRRRRARGHLALGRSAARCCGRSTN